MDFNTKAQQTQGKELDPYNIDIVTQNDEQSLAELIEELCQYVLENNDDGNNKNVIKEQSDSQVIYNNFIPPVDVSCSINDPLQKKFEQANQYENNKKDVCQTFNAQPQFSYQYQYNIVQRNNDTITYPQDAPNTDEVVQLKFNKFSQTDTYVDDAIIDSLLYNIIAGKDIEEGPNYNITYDNNTQITASASENVVQQDDIPMNYVSQPILTNMQHLKPKLLGFQQDISSCKQNNLDTDNYQPEYIELMPMQQNHLSDNTLMLENCNLPSTNNECNARQVNEAVNSDNGFEEMVEQSVSTTAQSNNKTPHQTKNCTKEVGDIQWGMFLDKWLNENGVKQVGNRKSEKALEQIPTVSNENPVQNTTPPKGNIKIYGEFNADDYIRQIYRVLGSYECYLCDYIGEDTYTLRTHMRRQHPTGTDLLQCGNCPFVTQIRNSLISHMKHQHCNNEKYRCVPCNFETTHRQSFLYHLRFSHVNADYPRHLPCGFVTRQKESVVKHMRHVHGKSLVLFHCNKCGFSTGYASSMKRHKSCRHKIIDAAVYECTKCDFKSSYKRDLVHHTRATHSKTNQVYKCKQCTYTAHVRRSVKKHTIMKHGGKAFQCTLCSFETRDLKTSREHVMCKHDGNIRYTCKSCSFATIYHMEMTYHRSHAHTRKKKNMVK